jgi:catechol 2,3-dioxygenase-like lactoylglutathione lyase family enzyme
MQPYLEHINITSTDVLATVKFLQTAMPELQIRGSGDGEDCRKWVHLGTQTTYVAIEDRGAKGKGPHIPYTHAGYNHMGFVVDDIDAVVNRLEAAGFEGGLKNLEHPHRKRWYFYDHDDNEYEFVEYLSDENSERNDYSQ